MAHSKIVEEIRTLPRGPNIGAFFEFDGTLIAGDSAPVFINEHIHRSNLTKPQVRRMGLSNGLYSVKQFSSKELVSINKRYLAGFEEEAYRLLGREVSAWKLVQLVYPESRALVQAHLEQGHTVAIISSATLYQLEHVAENLGIKHIRCTKMATQDGRLTGRLEGHACVGLKKAKAVLDLAKENDIDLTTSFYYTGNDKDIEALKRVGNPRLINPNNALTKIARGKKWPIRRFSSRGKVGPLRKLRSKCVESSVFLAWAASIPIYAFTGSKRRARNFGISLYADLSSAFAGLELNIHGEQHLWKQRPAVFIFNHQSQADLIIIASLVRRDIAGVGKKEIRDMPLLGAIFEQAGSVFIDRKNSASAIEAMQPVVDALAAEGRSVMIAPEGTRSNSPKLLPFKKGAFHIAMQAGVPIIPIVIHNAMDAQPKGDMYYYPATVDIDVLEPVDTSTWTSKNLDENIKQVRNSFLEALGQ